MAYALLTDLSGKPLNVFPVNEPYDCKGEFKLKKRFRTANMLRDEIVYQVATFIMVLHQFFFVFRKYLFIKYLHLGGKEKNVKNF